MKFLFKFVVFSRISHQRCYETETGKVTAEVIILLLLISNYVKANKKTRLQHLVTSVTDLERFTDKTCGLINKRCHLNDKRRLLLANKNVLLELHFGFEIFTCLKNCKLQQF